MLLDEITAQWLWSLKNILSVQVLWCDNSVKDVNAFNLTLNEQSVDAADSGFCYTDMR